LLDSLLQEISFQIKRLFRMSVDCPPTSLQLMTRKYRVFASCGKISLSQVVCTPRQRPESSDQIQIRPCSVKVQNCHPTPGLFWDVEKVTLKDETVELHYSGVVIDETEEFENESLVKCLSKYEDDCNRPLPQRFQKFDKHKNALESKDYHMSKFSTISEEDDKFKIPGRNVKCFKCDRKFQNTKNMRQHALTHFASLYDVLPNKKPFSCPICGQVSSKRYRLLLHYALGHRKVLQLTDTRLEDWKFSERKIEEISTNESNETGNKISSRRLQP